MIFEQRWLDRPLPPVDPLTRRRIETEARARQAFVAVNFPDTLRMVLRKQLLIGDCSMDSVAQLLGMHRRTLDRRLQRHGVHYGDLLESVQADLARQLLVDTGCRYSMSPRRCDFRTPPISPPHFGAGRA